DKANRRLMIGIIVLASGVALIPIPGIEHYAFEQIFYTVGSILLVSPVLEQRLFDPISQLNVKLKHRAEQLALIARVGQHANTVLALEKLLQTVAEDIQKSFDYDCVTIFLLDKQQHVTTKA